MLQEVRQECRLLGSQFGSQNFEFPAQKPNNGGEIEGHVNHVECAGIRNTLALGGSSHDEVFPLVPLGILRRSFAA